MIFTPYDDAYGGRQSSFAVALQASLTADRSMGGGTATFTRASTAYQTDFEAKLNLLPSGAARMQGARVVQNLVTGSSVDITAAGWSLGGSGATRTAAYAVGPDGTQTASRLQINAGANGYLRQTATVPNGSTNTLSVWVQSNTGVAQNVVIFHNGGGGAEQTSNISIGTTGKWITFTRTATSTGNLWGILGDGVNATDILVWGFLFENTTGQANQSPASGLDYPSVGVLSTPYHGLGVDGIKAFSTLNGNTVASNVVTEATGAPIVAGASGVSAYAPVDTKGPFGFLAEFAATQLIPTTADIRDMTGVNWVNGGTLTIARTQVGADGTANSANLITGGAVAATNTVLLTPVLAGASRTYSLLLKRGTGTGAVSLTIDGTNYTDISASLNTAVFTLVKITANVVPIIGLKVTTNLDTVIADMNQLEAGANATSPITTAGATRRGDLLTYALAGNIDATKGSVYMEVTDGRILGDISPYIYSDNGSPMHTTGDFLKMFDGTTVFTGIAYTRSTTTVQKIASVWNSSGGIWNTFLSGTAGTQAATFDGDLSMGTGLYIGHSGVVNSPINGTIRNVRIYASALPNAQLTTMTQP